jgi:hypothetical protein
VVLFAGLPFVSLYLAIGMVEAHLDSFDFTIVEKQHGGIA